MVSKICMLLTTAMISSLLFSGVAFAKESTQNNTQVTTEQTTNDSSQGAVTVEDTQLSETPLENSVVETEQPVSELEETLPANDIVIEVGTDAPPDPAEGSWEDVTNLAK